ncbi:protein enabled homolog [Schistocerca nitens]|uniref:protein enabled homolog n=1 Tax=Schistocerca nitens TaxID=7011 RepID=UPI002117DB07|nr:protein enabled homolog [Schistocerca nitens]
MAITAESASPRNSSAQPPAEDPRRTSCRRNNTADVTCPVEQWPYADRPCSAARLCRVRQADLWAYLLADTAAALPPPPPSPPPQPPIDSDADRRPCSRPGPFVHASARVSPSRQPPLFSGSHSDHVTKWPGTAVYPTTTSAIEIGAHIKIVALGSDGSRFQGEQSLSRFQWVQTLPSPYDDDCLICGGGSVHKLSPQLAKPAAEPPRPGHHAGPSTPTSTPTPTPGRRVATPTPAG